MSINAFSLMKDEDSARQAFGSKRSSYVRAFKSPAASMNSLQFCFNGYICCKMQAYPLALEPSFNLAQSCRNCVRMRDEQPSVLFLATIIFRIGERAYWRVPKIQWSQLHTLEMITMYATCGQSRGVCGKWKIYYSSARLMV